jgi:calreticulin
MKTILLSLFFAFSIATVYFSEDFGEGWDQRWVASQWKDSSERGVLKQVKGEHGDGKDTGVQTSEDARFYTYSAKIPKTFSNKGKTLIFQYTVKHEQNLDCGGSYLKFLPGPIDQASFKGGEGENKYNIMFGPDWCGGGLKRIHAIFNYDGKNHLLERNTIRVPAEPHVTHLYSLHVHPNNSYSIYVDNNLEQYGSLAERPDYTMLPEKEIPDPAVSKPADWVDEPEMVDPTDTKPSGWDDIPATIADPDAKKPDDWDDELDGEWEAP